MPVFFAFMLAPQAPRRVCQVSSLRSYSEISLRTRVEATFIHVRIGVFWSPRHATPCDIQDIPILRLRDTPSGDIDTEVLMPRGECAMPGLLLIRWPKEVLRVMLC